MGRSYYINGQCMVSVRGSPASLQPAIGGAYQQLGLTDGNGKVTIIPNYAHGDYRYDDYGPQTPPDVQWWLTDAEIMMTLVHFDPAILSACISESAAGGTEGTMVGAGTPMGAGKALYDPSNHYITLLLQSPHQNNPWRFLASYLARRPFVWPLGAERSLVQCYWRAIPYQPLGTAPGAELLSAGAVIWDHTSP